MNIQQTILGSSARLGEVLLAETAVRIELPPSKHRLAVERYEALRKHIERNGSPLCDLVGYFYPQGSMAIRATIQSRKRGDGFDIDIIAELLVSKMLSPAQVLDLLFEAINGEKGSLYHGKVERQTRCVTVYYADGMHLDVTPSQLLSAADPRRSQIFHAKPEEPPATHRRITVNSWGFCEWFNEMTPADVEFAKAYGAMVRTKDGTFVVADEAQVKDVPAHTSEDGAKSATVVALQLMKRNRNIRYASRSSLRMPPSVMLAKFAGDTSVPRTSIAEALDALILTVLSALEQAEVEGRLISVENPRCAGEFFTDRWPENREAQRLYIGDLKTFRAQLAALMIESAGLDEKRELLVKMFGEGPADDVIKGHAQRLGAAIRTGARTVSPTGRIIPAAAAAAVSRPAPAVSQPRQHTFYGDPWKTR